MKEIVYDYKEFCERVSKEKPIHYSFKIISGKYSLNTIVLSIQGINSKDNNMILGFEITVGDIHHSDVREIVKRLKKTYVAPLNATEGRYE